MKGTKNSPVLVARAAKTKYYRLSGLTTRNFFPHSFGGYKSKMKVSAGLVSSEDLSSGLVDDHFLPVSSHGLSSVYTCLCPKCLSSVKTLNMLDQGPP